MLSHKHFLLAVLVVLFMPLTARPSADPGSLAAIQAEAKENSLPMVVLVYQEGADDARKMMNQTWQAPEVQALFGANFLSYQVKASSAERQQLPLANVRSTSLLMVLHPSGGLMGSVEGFVAAPTLVKILNRHWLRLYPRAPKALPVLRKPSPKLSLQVASSRTFNLEVKGLESYSLSQLSLSQTQTPAVGVLLGSYSRTKKIEREIRKLKKRWPGQMWVFEAQGEDLAQPTYNLVLGAFRDVETAKRYATAMEQYAARDTDLLDLHQIVNR